MNEPVGGIRLGYEVINTVLHCPNRHIDIAMAGYHDDGEVGIQLTHAAEQFQAVDTRHADIGNDNSVEIRCEVSQGTYRIRKGDHRKSGQFQRLPVGISQIVVIVHKGYARQIVHQKTLGR